MDVVCGWCFTFDAGWLRLMNLHIMQTRWWSFKLYQVWLYYITCRIMVDASIMIYNGTSSMIKCQPRWCIIKHYEISYLVKHGELVSSLIKNKPWSSLVIRNHQFLFFRRSTAVLASDMSEPERILSPSDVVLSFTIEVWVPWNYKNISSWKDIVLTFKKVEMLTKVVWKKQCTNICTMKWLVNPKKSY